MSIGFSRFDSLQVLAGTAVAIVSIAQAAETVALTAREIAQIAVPTTVQINNDLIGGGSGAIVAKSGNTYTVLTVNHVVKRRDLKYTIRTHTGKDYPVTQVQRLQKSENDPDLALVSFESSDEYPIATLGDSDRAAIGVDVYVSGYPVLAGRSGAERDLEFSPGIVTSRPTRRSQGYTLRYNAVTVSGMSGGPVFDANGRVVGIHGQGESESSTISELGAITIKTGFNSAIPINTFVALRSKTGLSASEVKVNNAPVNNGQAPPSLSNPSNARDYYARGLSRFDSGDREGAIEDFTQATRLDPKFADAFNSRGNARYYLEDKQGAIADYTEAIQLNPKFADAYNNRANARSEIGDEQGAMADRNQALQASSQERGNNTPDANGQAPLNLSTSSHSRDYYARGLSRLDSGDREGAIEYFTKAIRLDPNFADAYNSRGNARYNLGDKQGAIADYTEAIRLDPNLADAYNNRSNARYSLGDKQGALEDLNQANQLNTINADTYKR